MRYQGTHHCDAQVTMAAHNRRQRLKIVEQWYGWTIQIPATGEDIQITYCPFCGKDLEAGFRP